MKNNKKLLVHLHLYYHDQIDFMLQKLNNIVNCDWDLYVTICNENKDSEEKILNFKPEAKIIKVENYGYDIYPFLQVLDSIDISLYNYVLKIHTKNYRKKLKLNGFSKKLEKFKGYGWRNELINSLIGSKNIFENNLNLLKDPSIGMLCSKDFLLPLKNCTAEDIAKLELLKKTYNLNTNYEKFCAGTMFLVKSEILETLKAVTLSVEDFKAKAETNTTGTLAHSFERIFTLLCTNKGLSVRPVKYTFFITICNKFKKLLDFKIGEAK